MSLDLEMNWIGANSSVRAKTHHYDDCHIHLRFIFKNPLTATTQNSSLGPMFVLSLKWKMDFL